MLYRRSFSSQMPVVSEAVRRQEARDKALALPVLTNRARVEGGLGVYTVAPRANIDTSAIHRQPGQSGEEAFRRLKLRHQMKGQAKR
jgi:transcription factor SPN1